MAYLELAIEELENQVRSDFPTHLSAVQAEHNDGLVLEPFETIEWEEVHELPATPALLLVGHSESDPTLRDQLVDATILAYVVIRDANKRYVTKKLYRYAEALRRFVRDVPTRTLSHRVVSVKVERTDYTPVYTDPNNFYCRDFQATLVVRMMREGM